MVTRARVAAVCLAAASVLAAQACGHARPATPGPSPSPTVSAGVGGSVSPPACAGRSAGGDPIAPYCPPRMSLSAPRPQITGPPSTGATQPPSVSPNLSPAPPPAGSAGSPPPGGG
jgi:hypothetical protein